MKIRRRTAAWIAAGAVALSLAGAAWRVTRPAYLRRQILALGQGQLNEGWRLEIDSVDYSLLAGVASIEGIRLVRSDTGAVVGKVARAEAEISFAALFGRGRLASVIRIHKPEATVERGADGRFPLLGAFRPGGGGKVPSGHPRVEFTDGMITVIDPSFLAEKESIVLAVEALSIGESRSGEPAGITGALAEKGAPGNESGALGKMRVSGEVPCTRTALRVSIDRCSIGEPLQRRLAKEIRAQLEALDHLSGELGDEGNPALEIAFLAPESGPAVVEATVRPRNLAVTLREHRYPLTDGLGEITWTGSGGSQKIRIRRLELRHGPTTFQVRGEIDLSSPEAPFEVRFSATNLRLDQELHDAYPKNLQKVWDTYAFHGTVNIGAPLESGNESLKSFLRRSVPGGPVEVDISAELLDTGLSFKGPLGADGIRRGFDWAVDGVTGTVSVKFPADSAGATAILLQGVHGKHRWKGEATEVSAEGSVVEWHDRTRADITLKAENVPLDDSVRDCSPLIAGLFKEYGARGRLSSLQVHIEQEDLPGAPTLATVTGEFGGKGGMTWKEMPLPVEGISGTVTYNERLLQGRKAVIIEITGVRGTDPMGAAVFADGTIEGEGEAAIYHLNVRADAILLDGPLQSAIEASSVEVAKNLWKNMSPSGPADLEVAVLGPKSKLEQAVSLTLRGAYLEGWEEVRFPVSNLTGKVELRGGNLDLRSVRGLHAGREVTLTGGGKVGDDRTLLDLALATTSFPLDERARPILGPALSEKMKGYFETVAPRPGLEGDVTIRLQGPGDALEPTVTVENLRGGAAPFDLKDLVFAGGTVRYADGTIAIQDLAGRMGDREMRIPSGGLRFDRGEGNLVVEVRRLAFPGDLVGLIPADTASSLEEILPDRLIHFEGLRVALSEGWRRLEMSGAVSLRPRMEGESAGLNLEGSFDLDRFTLLRSAVEGLPTEISGGLHLVQGSFDAGVGVRDFSGRLDLRGSLGAAGQGVEGTLSGVRARVAGRELRDAGGEIGLKDGVFRVMGFRGTLAGGDVGLTLEVGGRRAYEGRVTLSNARAREFLAPADPDSPIRGQVESTISFRKPRADRSVLEGDGQVDIKNGKLFAVPVFAGISNLMGRKDPPEFTTGHMVFAIKDDKLTFSAIDLDSSVMRIHLGGGRSAAWTDGRLDLSLVPETKPGRVIDVPWTIIKTITDPILDRVFTFYVRGTVQRPEVTWLIPPGLLGGDDRNGPAVLVPPAFPVEPRAPWDF